MEYHCDDAKKWKSCIKFSKLCKIQTIAEYTLYQVRFHPVLLLRAALLLPVFLLLCPMAHNVNADT
jgi:hypothetical protein